MRASFSFNEPLKSLWSLGRFKWLDMHTSEDVYIGGANEDMYCIPLHRSSGICDDTESVSKNGSTLRNFLLFLEDEKSKSSHIVSAAGGLLISWPGEMAPQRCRFEEGNLGLL